MNPISINLPPIKVSYDPFKKWCWTAPNGATGTHENSAVQAASVAIAGMGCRPSEADMTIAKEADEALRIELTASKTPNPPTSQTDTDPK